MDSGRDDPGHKPLNGCGPGGIQRALDLTARSLLEPDILSAAIFLCEIQVGTFGCELNAQGQLQRLIGARKSARHSKFDGLGAARTVNT